MRRLFPPVLLLVLLGLLAAAPASAADPSRTLRAAEALLTTGPQAAGTGDEGGREATLLLRDLARVKSRLPDAQRRRADRLLRRPSNPGNESYFGAEDPASPLCDANFCIHWGTRGENPPPPRDSQPNGIPDYVERVLGAAKRSFAVENGTLGWRKARSDGARGSRAGRGAEGQVDVYLAALPRGLFGYATGDPDVGGRSRPAFLVIDNDYSGFGGDPLELMRVTMAHEYNHVLQFGYDSFQDGWMFESTATWVEEYVYPEIDDYFNFLPPFYENPDKPLAERGRRPLKPYGSAMWNHWLAGRLGAATIRDAWALSRSVRPKGFAIAAYEAAIDANGGSSFSREFGAFAAATAELNSGRNFPDAGSYSDLRRSGKIGLRKRKFRLDHTAYRLFRVKRGGKVRLVVRVRRRTRAAIALIGRKGPASGGAVRVSLTRLGRGGRGVVRLADAGAYDRVTAVIVNSDGRVKRYRNYRSDKRVFKAKIR